MICQFLQAPRRPSVLLNALKKNKNESRGASSIKKKNDLVCGPILCRMCALSLFSKIRVFQHSKRAATTTPTTTTDKRSVLSSVCVCVCFKRRPQWSLFFFHLIFGACMRTSIVLNAFFS